MVLGTLFVRGPMHGHQIRRVAEVTNVDEWGGVSVGALYRELRVMDGEGLVEPLRTERVGRRPARTVYAITDEGRLELAMLRERAVSTLYFGPDPLGVALTFAGTAGDKEQLSAWLHARRERFAIIAEQLAAERPRLLAKGYTDPFAAANMRRGELHAETEVRWHDEFAKVLSELPRDAPPGADPPQQPALPAGVRSAPAQPAHPARGEDPLVPPAQAGPVPQDEILLDSGNRDSTS
jgi:DNA-binding PadR family transcriptional regulator